VEQTLRNRERGLEMVQNTRKDTPGILPYITSVSRYVPWHIRIGH
jgi:hypothetical protein